MISSASLVCWRIIAKNDVLREVFEHVGNIVGGADGNSGKATTRKR